MQRKSQLSAVRSSQIAPAPSNPWITPMTTPTTSSARGKFRSKNDKGSGFHFWTSTWRPVSTAPTIIWRSLMEKIIRCKWIYMSYCPLWCKSWWFLTDLKNMHFFFWWFQLLRKRFPTWYWVSEQHHERGGSDWRDHQCWQQILRWVPNHRWWIWRSLSMWVTFSCVHNNKRQNACISKWISWQLSSLPYANANWPDDIFVVYFMNVSLTDVYVNGCKLLNRWENGCYFSNVKNYYRIGLEFPDVINIGELDSYGFIMSPNHPSNYPNNLACRWDFVTNSTSTLRNELTGIAFLRTRTQWDEDTQTGDQVTVYLDDSTQEMWAKRILSSQGSDKNMKNAKYN